MHKLGMLLFVSLLLTASVGPSHAQADEKSHRAAVMELFKVMQMERLIEKTLDASLEMQLSANPALGAFAPKLRQFLAKHMSWAALQEDFVRLYAGAFTEDEVKQLVTFYKTPVGKKTLQQMPKLMQQGAELGMARVQKHMPELMEMMQEEAAPKP